MKFEFPLNEKIRTMLRLENLFNKWNFFASQEYTYNHHAAILTLFEILEIATRLDLRTDLSKEVDRQIQVLLHIRNQSDIDTNIVEQLLTKMQQTSQELNVLFTKGMLTTDDQDWLNLIKSRSLIPGGTCEFDIPSYHMWQQQSLQARQQDLNNWIAPLKPLHRAAQTILNLLRQSGQEFEHIAERGVFQQMLSSKVYQLLQLEYNHEAIFAEVSGNKYMITVRFHELDAKKQIRAVHQNVPFKLSLCNF